MSILRRIALPATALVLLGGTAHAEGQLAAKLQALDKVTARISALDAPIDAVVKFGTLEATVRACYKAPPEEPPENAAFLEIRELRRNEEPRVVFNGWMFSSTPGLSTLEHPVYDIWVVDCVTLPPPGAAVPNSSSSK